MCIATIAEHADLEQKNNELVDILREKSKAHSHVQKMYQSLKAQVMASRVVNAAGDEVDMALNTVSGDRFVDRIPGVRTGAGGFTQQNMSDSVARRRTHRPNESISSGGGVGQRGRATNTGQTWNSQSQSHGLGNRVYSGNRKSHSIPGMDIFLIHN